MQNLPNISIELNPKNIKEFRKEVDFLENTPFNRVNIVAKPGNQVGACDAVSLFASEYGFKSVAHIRSRDWSIQNVHVLVSLLMLSEVDSILIVKGDKIDPECEFPTTPLELAVKLKEQLPDLTIYGALNPHTSAAKAEPQLGIDRGHQLLETFDGLFTQPFFDLALFDLYLDGFKDRGEEIYWGMSSITHQWEHNFWSQKVGANIDDGYKPLNLQWNKEVFAEYLPRIKQNGNSACIMPVKSPLTTMLGLLGYESGVHDGH